MPNVNVALNSPVFSRQALLHSYNNRWSDHVVSLSGGKVRFELHGDKPLETSATFNDGEWHHVITTVGPDGQQLQVDGKLIATGSLSRRTKVTNRLGLDLGPGDSKANVTIDDVTIYSGVRLR